MADPLLPGPLWLAGCVVMLSAVDAAAPGTKYRMR